MNFSLLMEKALKRGITDIEVYTETKSGSEISTFNKMVDKNEAYSESVSNVRGVYNNKIATVYVENQSDDFIDNVLDEIIKNASIVESDEPYFIYEGDKEYPTLPKKSHDFDSYTQEDKIKLCEKIEDFVRSKSDCCQIVNTSIIVEEATLTIENTKGLNVMKKSASAVCFVMAVAKRGDEQKQSYAVQYLTNLKDIDFEALAKDSILKAESQFGATSVESKGYRVLLDNKISQMLLQVFSKMFCADSILKNMSMLKDKLNQKVFGENITIIDDPLNEKALEATPFDDEGVASYKKNVVENGVLKTYLHNLSTAKMMGVKSTANGFKEGISGNVGVMAKGLYIKPGDLSFDEMLKKLDNGLYITDMQGAHAGVNVAAGSFSLQSSGYLVENGKITKPVTLIIVSGTIFEVLSNCEAIGNDLEFRGCGAPSLLISNMAVSGK